MKSKNLFVLLVMMNLILSGCEKEMVDPSKPKFKINAVEVNAMPALDFNNLNWDLFDDADVFFNIENESHIPYYLGSSNKVSNVSQADLPVSWTLTSSYQISDISKNTFVAVYDYDVLDANDSMGYVGFRLEDYVDAKPTSITKTSGDLTITITGVWY